MTPRLGAALLVAVALAAAPGCDPAARAAAGASDALRFVHVRWPGRPASDAFERRVLADPRVVRWARRAAFAVVDVGAAPPAVTAALDGVGTVAWSDVAGVVAVRRGVGDSAAVWRRWIEGVERDAPRWIAGCAAGRADAAQAELAFALGLVAAARSLAEPLAAAGDRAAMRVLVAIRLAAGEVAAARRAFGALAASAAPADRRLDARILLAERRARAALERLAPAGDEPATWFLRAEAHAALGETALAHALYGRVIDAAVDPDLADRARRRFASGVFEPHRHGGR